MAAFEEHRIVSNVARPPFPRSLAEHAGRKLASLQAVADSAGVVVAVADAAGHGSSEPQEQGLRGVVRRFDHLVSKGASMGTHARTHTRMHAGAPALRGELATHGGATGEAHGPLAVWPGVP